ncbi:MAG: FeoB-associated Cys-rich membrane protein [Sphaerochaetaceae bacterium]|nr:FeoB-associated Cys-rich membrane protein [Sphaerochaetaceae bacterium]
MNPIIANILVAGVILALLAAAILVTVRQRRNERCGCSSGNKKKCPACDEAVKKQKHDCSKGCSGCPFAGSCH